MAKIKRMRRGKILKGLMTYTIVVVDDSGEMIAASIIRQEKDEGLEAVYKALDEETERLENKFPEMRVVKRQVPNVTELRRLYPEVLLPSKG